MFDIRNIFIPFEPSISNFSIKALEKEQTYSKLTPFPKHSIQYIRHLAKKVLLAEEFSNYDSDTIYFDLLPHVYDRLDAPLRIDPGYLRLCWAKEAGYRFVECLFFDQSDKWDCTEIGIEGYLELIDLNQHISFFLEDKVLDQIPTLMFKNFPNYLYQGLQRLKYSLNKDNQNNFKISIASNLTESQKKYLELLADTKLQIVKGNGWEIESLVPGAEGEKYHNYPRRTN